MTKFQATLYYSNANIVNQTDYPSISEDFHDDRINYQPSTARNRDGYQQGKVPNTRT